MMMSISDQSRVGLMQRVLLRGNYAEGNFGDDALLLAAYKLIEPYAATIVVDGRFAYHDRRSERLEGPPTGAESWDAILYGGGTQFFAFDHHSPVLQKSLAQRLLRKLMRPTEVLKSCKTRLRMRREVRTLRLAIGIGVGPFSESSPEKSASVSLLAEMAFVWVRDDASSSFCKRHKVARTIRSTDLCFTQAFAEAVIAPVISPRTSDRQQCVGIILRDWKAFDNTFFEAMVETARGLRTQGVDVTFFSFAPSDVRMCAALSRLGENVISWDSETDAIETYWGKFVQMDLVVTARYHGAVFALLGDTPFLVIGIEQKLQCVQEWAISKDAPNLVLPCEADPRLMMGEILSALDQGALRRSAGRVMLMEQRRLAQIGERRLAEFFGKIS